MAQGKSDHAMTWFIALFSDHLIVGRISRANIHRAEVITENTLESEGQGCRGVTWLDTDAEASAQFPELVGQVLADARANHPLQTRVELDASRAEGW